MTLQLIIKQIRVYQWVKNLLIFVPLILAHGSTEPHALMHCILGFAAMSMLASSVYVLNDIADVEHDRNHPRKRYRPIASGAIGLPQAWFLVVTLISACIVLCINYLPVSFVGWMGVYAVSTTLYSFLLKRMVLVDVMSLSGLYSLRIAAGGAAAGVAVSPWLLGFSLFLFMSLAFLKRYTELLDTIERDGHVVSGRGYHVGDASFVLIAGASLGFVAVLIFTLYINGADVEKLYANPMLLWLIAPCMVYWLSHLWLTAHRGGMHDDPIVFAVRDIGSWVVGFVIICIAVAAAWVQ